MLLVVEGDRRVRAVAPGFGLGPAAPAQRCNGRYRRGLTEKVRDRCGTRHQIGTVFAHANAALRIAGNVSSDVRKLLDSRLRILMPDGRQVVSARARFEQRGAIVGRARACEVHRQSEHGFFRILRQRLDTRARVVRLVQLCQGPQDRRTQSGGKNP
jgi:hypothetical protein